MTRLPHPIPYQGSKRSQAGLITDYLRSLAHRPRVLFEPFVGSAAVTLAAANLNLADRFRMGDSLAPLIGVWNQTVENPKVLADRYEEIWTAQLGNEAVYYNEVRYAFNADQEPAKLLYLMARCVKNAIRFNKDGQFNQSPDHRRKGMHPDKMRPALLGAHAILKGRTSCAALDYNLLLQEATPSDVVYMDPPYQGTSESRDQRYFQSLDLGRFIEALDALNQRNVPFIVSFDGRCGTKTYGAALPPELQLIHVEIEVGRSSQATLNGDDHLTVESLYLSRQFAAEPKLRKVKEPSRQISLLASEPGV